ncbi:MAG: UDP-N-acetylglucosamine 2-epimerase, partial [Patescibacteria group bacterium]|nr:UDP-N-acetylglucosamine 2-epimerase [Patescibacteria group bacterium]
TIHRRENVDNKVNLRKICSVINSLSKKHHIVFPVHPHTRKRLEEFGIRVNADLCDPASYVELLKILAKSNLAITDSGGLQKEVYWMGRPCITLLERIGWVETVKEKANFLFPLSKPIKLEKIEKISRLDIRPKHGLFGYGNASKKIVSTLLNQ